MPSPPRLLCAVLPDSCDITDLTFFFDMFINDKEFDGFVKNTNNYTLLWLVQHPESQTYHQKPTNRQEIKTYFAILIFLGL